MNKHYADYGQRNSERAAARTVNTGLTKMSVQCSADTFINESFVLRINPPKADGKNSAHRKSANRYA